MFTLEDLKSNRKEIVEKILETQGRDKVISFCSQLLDKRAYFTIDMNGNIKRKKMNYVIPATVFAEKDVDFICCVVDSLDFTEKTKFEKLERMTSIENIEKSILKLLAKGDFHFAGKYCKELYMRNSDELFKMLFQFALIDNISFEKPLAVYSLKKYFEKFGYSDEALYLTVSYLAKMRGDFSEYERIKANKSNTENIENSQSLKEELRDIFKSNIEKYKTTKGLQILGYLSGLLSYSYENEDIFVTVLKREMKIFENGEERGDDRELTGISVDIFEGLSKEV